MRIVVYAIPKNEKWLYASSIDIAKWSNYNLPQVGPIAQLGERFNGIEEVKGSSPFRSISTSFSSAPFPFSPNVI